MYLFWGSSHYTTHEGKKVWCMLINGLILPHKSFSSLAWDVISPRASWKQHMPDCSALAPNSQQSFTFTGCRATRWGGGVSGERTELWIWPTEFDSRPWPTSVASDIRTYPGHTHKFEADQRGEVWSTNPLWPRDTRRAFIQQWSNKGP